MAIVHLIYLKDSIITVTSKEEILQNPKKFEMEGLQNHSFEPRSKME
jgi:hypothetical protein